MSIVSLTAPQHDKEEPCDISDAIDEPPAGLDTAMALPAAHALNRNDYARYMPFLPRFPSCSQSGPGERSLSSAQAGTAKLITCSTFPDGCHKSVGHWLMFILSLAVVLLLQFAAILPWSARQAGKATSNITRRCKNPVRNNVLLAQVATKLIKV